MNRIDLHPKPLCTHFQRAVTLASIRLVRISEDNLVLLFSGALLQEIGSMAAIPLAAVEAVFTAAIGGIGFSVGYLLRGALPDFWERHSIQLLSYSFHSLLTITFSIVAILDLKILTEEFASTIVSFIDQSLYMRSHFDAQREEVWENLLIQMNRAPFIDAINALLEDSRGELQLDEEQKGRVILCMEQNERVRELMAECDLFEAYDSRYVFLACLDRAFQEVGIRIMNHYEQLDIDRMRGYKGYLGRILKESFKTLYRTERLWRHLNSEDKDGNERLKDLEPEVFQPLAAFAQYQELLHPLYEGEMLKERQVLLQIARKDLEPLTEAEREDLEQRLLRSDGGGDDRVRIIYSVISCLAIPLYRGQSVPIQKACERALEELGIGLALHRA
jgi:hypothetical protein